MHGGLLSRSQYLPGNFDQSLFPCESMATAGLWEWTNGTAHVVDNSLATPVKTHP